MSWRPGERNSLDLVPLSVETHERSYVLYRWPDKDEDAEQIFPLGRRLGESRGHRLGLAGVPVTFCAHGAYAVGRETVQIEVATPRRQTTAESDFGRLRDVEARPALCLASVHDEGQVVTMTPLTSGRVQEYPGFAICTYALQRDDSRINHALSLPRTWWGLRPKHPDLPQGARVRGDGCALAG